MVTVIAPTVKGQYTDFVFGCVDNVFLIIGKALTVLVAFVCHVIYKLAVNEMINLIYLITLSEG